MRKSVAVRCPALAIGLIVLAICACTGTSKPSQFYLMYPMDPDAAAPAANPLPPQISIGVGPVSLREHLKRPQIVVRTAGSEIKVSEFHRWAESLEENFLQVVTQNLMLLFDSENVFLFPWSNRLKLDYQVDFKVYRFDVEQSKSAVLDVRWTVSRLDDRSVVLSRRAGFKQDVKSDAYEDIVNAHSQLLEELSRQLAADIENLHLPD